MNKPKRVATSQPLNTPATVDPPVVATAAKARVDVAEFTMNAAATTTKGSVPWVTCSTETARPAVKYVKARVIASPREKTSPEGTSERRPGKSSQSCFARHSARLAASVPMTVESP